MTRRPFVGHRRRAVLRAHHRAALDALNELGPRARCSSRSGRPGQRGCRSADFVGKKLRPPGREGQGQLGRDRRDASLDHRGAHTMAHLLRRRPDGGSSADPRHRRRDPVVPAARSRSSHMRGRTVVNLSRGRHPNPHMFEAAPSGFRPTSHLSARVERSKGGAEGHASRAGQGADVVIVRHHNPGLRTGWRTPRTRAP